MGNYYLSYAEDLSTETMKEKCTEAKMVMICQLIDYRLKFCCHAGSVFATIEKHRDSCVPAILWQMEDGAYFVEERVSKGYHKKIVGIKNESENITAFLFVMDGEQSGMPTEELLNAILDGYEEHSFDPQTLEDALDEVIQVAQKEGDENGSVF